MITGIGIDAVELDRMKQIIETKSTFIQRVLTKAEYQKFIGLSLHRQIEFLAGRFACKEAFSKAWGTGIGKIDLQDIEILVADNGAPIVTKSPHSGQVFVSITHTESLAIAQIVLED